jgi:hypothetical protein
VGGLFEAEVAAWIAFENDLAGLAFVTANLYEEEEAADAPPDDEEDDDDEDDAACADAWFD